MDAEENQKQVSSAPTALGNRQGGDSHIPTAATRPWTSGKPKTGFPLSHSTVFDIPNSKQKGTWRRGRSATASRLILQ